jgi:transglutaminase-like putative cysteine protease
MAVLLSCSNGHLIDDKSLRESVAGDYRARSEILDVSRGDLSMMADTISDIPLREAVTFLLAYMPLSDLAVYEPDYTYANAAAALDARSEMPWGGTVPAEIFLNFVLPVRVNNENPDNFRVTCYNELRERVVHLGPMEAALEINHWCQEKVAYQAADSRTSSPMATMLSARGRCGEESTFTVSALRTVGIPARQVYTPRWAHTDDNHAWVEFWVDGSWHYLGACEPEPLPDRGWFTEPARRAMLVHTKAYGRYVGDEKVIRREQLFTEINALDRYAKTKVLKVKVTDDNGMPVPGAAAGFMLFNYAEFYPLATLTSDSNGECTLMTGFGSLLIWADDGDRYGFSQALPEDTLVHVTISLPDVLEETVPLDLYAPPVPEPYPGIDPSMARMNNILNQRGDSIRNAYINSWMQGVRIDDIARKAGIPAGDLSGLLKRSMGNYRSVINFLRSAGDSTGLALRILESISDKDLRDTPSDVLVDHLRNAPSPAPGSDTFLYDRYVLSPRISNELLSEFRSDLKSLPEYLVSSFRSDPASVAPWIDSTILITGSENHYLVPVVPGGVLRLRMADAHSRDIFFVALCRTAGIPSRLAPGTGRPQYHEKGEWHDVWFAGEKIPSGTPGFVSFTAGKNDQEPRYHINFTLAHIEQGRFRTLDFGYGERINDLPGGIPLDPGRYMLTTGTRDENGNVMASVSFFDLDPDEDATVKVTLRSFSQNFPEGKKINFDSEILTYSGDSIRISSVADSGIVMIWIEPGKEPTKHILNDLPGLKEEFDDWGGEFILLTDPAHSPADFDPGTIAGIPEKRLFAIDEGFDLMSDLLGSGSSEKPLPVVLCINNNGEILFSSEGYRIGTARQALNSIRK